MKSSIEISKKGNLVAVVTDHSISMYDMTAIEPYLKGKIEKHQLEINKLLDMLDQASTMQSVCDMWYNLKHPEKSLEKLAESIFGEGNAKELKPNV